MEHRIIFAGFGGQGVILAGKLVCIAAMREGKYVSHIPSYGAEMRGGTANCSVIISTEEIASPLVFNPTICCVFNNPSLNKFQSRIDKGGLLLYNSSLIADSPRQEDLQIVAIPANDLAAQAGSLKCVNMVMIGSLLKLKSQLAKLDSVINALEEAVSSRNKSLNQINKKALKLGFENVLN